MLLAGCPPRHVSAVVLASYPATAPAVACGDDGDGFVASVSRHAVDGIEIRTRRVGTVLLWTDKMNVSWVL